MTVRHIMVSDVSWDSGYYFIPWTPIPSARNVTETWEDKSYRQCIKWPLPSHRVYEVTGPIGDTTYVLLRAQAFLRDAALITIPPVSE